VAYVNEYASDEDIEKYKLNEVWDRYHPHKKDRRFWGRKPELTIDRDRDVFLMVHSSGAVAAGTQYRFLLSIKGKEAFVYLNLVEGSSPKFSDRPFYRIWDFVKTRISEYCDIEESEIIQEAKKAVSAFGYNGARKQIPETVVKFNF
jgi:hypothetical protein